MTVTKHSRILEATKEIWAPFTSGTESAGIGGHAGYYINANAEYAYLTTYIPWDFSKLTEAKIVLIPMQTLTPMTFRIVTDMSKAGRSYADHYSLLNYDVNTVAIRMTEVDIARSMLDIVDNAPLEAGEYLGVQVSRQVGQNTLAYFLGVRIRYNTPLYAKAP